ncbi:hypothetical protein [Rhabdochromatium marinum]|uniref:hypothetical protein n=1 Tax=Rhabdochromatium marinum TaxID=48729 RepID=UPI001907E30D|nr:hypothetical protein [Rhabdochromatium marinum]MBK1649051.1 hypothetical protein [Rhabdochromatium marinum]
MCALEQSSARLNLPAIAQSLQQVQAQFNRINLTLSSPRDPMSDQVLEQLLAGYRLVDQWLANGTQVFRLGESAQLLRLNAVVLWGATTPMNAAARNALQATEEHFYALGAGGIGELSSCYQSLGKHSVWHQAAQMYIQILSQPQLYLEGNHRTGTLVMSYLLARHGKPPFVLSSDNAKAYFALSTLIKNARKRSLRMLLERPNLAQQFAHLLQASADPGHVMPHRTCQIPEIT